MSIHLKAFESREALLQGRISDEMSGTPSGSEAIAVFSVACSGCKLPAAVKTDASLCPNCGDILEISYSGDVDGPGLTEQFKRRRLSDAAIDQSGVWRFRELLPFIQGQHNIVSFREGNAPEHQAPRAQDWCAVENLWVKHCGLNPTGSYKDTGMTAVMSRARELAVNAVICASTGNTAASLAVYAARASLRAVVLLPAAHVAEAKLAQTLDAGATVIAIDADFDGAMRVVQEVAAAETAYLVNSLNPFRREGQKTQAFEILERRAWKAPSWVVLPGGNLGNCTALAKGFGEALEWGLADRMPRLCVVQAAGAAPLVAVWERGGSLEPVVPETFATAIKIGNPVSWKPALRGLRESDGIALAAEDDVIAEARAVLARDGLACEPASAAALAGVRELRRRGLARADDDIVALLTGSGLKDIASIVRYHGDASNRFANAPLRAEADAGKVMRLIAGLPSCSA